MKATMKTVNLCNALKKGGLIKINKQLPVLSNFFIDFADGKGTIITTDMERAVKVTIDSIVDKNFFVIAPRKSTSMFLHGANGHVSLEVGKTPNQVIMQREGIGQCTLTAEGLPKDYPEIPQTKDLVWSKLDAKWFCQMLSIAITSCAKVDNRPILTGISFQDGVIVSLDGFRLTVIRNKKFAFGLEGKEVIIPSATAELVRRLFSNTESLEIAFELCKEEQVIRRVFFKSDNVLVVSEVIQGNYPKYEKLVPKSFECRVSFSSPLMLQRLNMIDKDSITSGIVRFTFNRIDENEHECSITATDGDGSRYTLTAPVKVESGDNGEIALNTEYVEDALRFFSLATMKLSSQASPIILTGDIEGLTIVIMPMYVEW
uniref:Putative DNA polymerase n=1 Tax=viral metagenome TaxID=1070528 RepID=A0A6M3LY39_9ZZZZ